MFVFKAHTKSIYSLAFSPDGRKDVLFMRNGGKVVAVNNDETVRIWEAPTWHEVPGFEWKIGKLGALAVSPDGFSIAGGSSTGKVIIWDTA